jgi:chemotaxis protein histidine kinase CheA
MTELTREQKLEFSRVRMAELATRFLARTDADIVAMRAALARLDKGDAEGLGEIRHLAHRMVGTGATLGFAPLSGCAQMVERIVEDCQPGQVPDESVRLNLAAAIEALVSEFSRQAGPRGPAS